MRTLPIGPPGLMSRKMVLFVPLPWYRCCYWHNWQTILWHALLTWSCKMSLSFLLLIHMVGPYPTVPQDRNLTLMYTPCSQSYSSVASCVIHEPPSDEIINLVSDAILIPIALNPFHTSLQAMNDCLSAWNFLLPRLTLLSIGVICSTREILICSFLGYPQMNFPYNLLFL